MSGEDIPPAVLEWFGKVNKDQTLLNKLNPDMLRALLFHVKALNEQTQITLRSHVMSKDVHTTQRELHDCVVKSLACHSIMDIPCGRCGVVLGFTHACECECCEDTYAELVSPFAKCADCTRSGHDRWPRPLCNACSVKGKCTD